MKQLLGGIEWVLEDMMPEEETPQKEGSAKEEESKGFFQKLLIDTSGQKEPCCGG